MPSLSELIDADARRVLRSVGGQPLRRAGEEAAELIRTRTRSGIDRHGRAFKPYAASTRAKKARRGQPVHPRTLTDTRAMLDRLTVTVPQSTQARVTVAPAPGRDQQVAQYQVNAGSDFMGLTPQNETAVAAIYGGELRRDIASTATRGARGRIALDIRL